MRQLICMMAALMIAACVSQYESELSQHGEWQELGAYHGEYGYQEWDKKRLDRLGVLSESDYEKYRAGYLQGRYEYCTGKKTVTTAINPAYPDECKQDASQFGLAERGY
ncbi:DUF2799 domain-containing protein [Photobacterium galatheae]|uniref:Lipoprotein n=1 Tax=Photobacterium galatheae TaxID=1654360 RepID=A0A066RS54_9GAMM|nr:DUF2799 domain-containing protein [Photobacterium galatheae]KDM90208.1 hypothetical protein EA58_18730 [Photobacterium galatheae]MCM0151194.1 DUF2799 domain-containing protein [Photobacterium galatheae]